MGNRRILVEERPIIDKLCTNHELSFTNFRSILQNSNVVDEFKRVESSGLYAK